MKRITRHWMLAVLVAACSAWADGPPPLRNATDPPGSTGTVAERVQPDWRAAIRLQLAASAERGGLSPSGRDELGRMYASRDALPLWLDSQGRPTAAAREALAVLAAASRHGMDPAAYGTAALAASAAALDAGSSSIDPSHAARFDVGLSGSMLGHLRHLHVGRVEAQRVGFKIPSRAQEHDYGAVLLAAVDGGKVRQAAEDMAPAFAQYRSLQAALARYRVLAIADTAPPLQPVKVSVHPGDAFAAAETLAQRLVAVGDLAPGAVPGGTVQHTAELSEGVKRFQRRHGLVDDGVLGKSTIAALNVPLAWRVRQIELAMERLRWLPHADGQPFIAINIPAFRLYARAPAAGPAGSLDMAVIVGRALNTQTPVFTDEMTHLIFRPYWNVPPSIMRGEVLPALHRRPDYLQAHGMEIVKGPGDDAQPVAASAENIALLRQGVLRLRQRPGPANALGLVKFVFPNDANVYMHDTPARELFSRSRRDFSHGCIRLEDPTALAEWALRDQPAWTRERIVAAMQGSKPQRVNLTQPVKVMLYYVTATVDPRDASVRFTDDIYGHDARLDRALKSVPALPGTDAAGVQVDEVRGGVVAHAARPH